jgi:hypothetical protein
MSPRDARRRARTGKHTNETARAGNRTVARKKLVRLFLNRSSVERRERGDARYEPTPDHRERRNGHAALSTKL